MNIHVESTPVPTPKDTRYNNTSASRSFLNTSRRTISDWVRTLESAIRSDLRSGLAVGAGLAAAWGLIAGIWTPRGPVVAGEVLGSLMISLAVGVLAGFLARSRWAALTGPGVFAAVFELARTGTEGATVEGFHASFYGILAFVAGRGLHGLLALAPMALGALLGAGVARGLSGVERRGSRLVVGRVALATALALLAFVALLLVAPASTEPIVGADGEPVAGSIAELATVPINGSDLTMMIRGRSTASPVLLFLAGGPGGSELGAMRRHLAALEEHFIVVTLEQRGSGKSYPALDPVSTLTLEGAVEDTIAVTNHLRERFGKEQIYLAGQSWGTTLGVLAIQEQPEIYNAFIGAGQMVSQRATDVIFYEDTVVWALETGRIDLFTELAKAGAPPYDELLSYETLFAHEQEIHPYDHSQNSEGAGQMAENLFVPEYTLLDRIHVVGGFVDTFGILYPQLQDIDFRETALSFDVPVFFVQGAHEARGRAQLFDEWYPMIDAPLKDLVVFDTSGHRPLWEQPDEFVDYLVGTVLPATQS